jgi:hypothetical protein
MNTHTVLQDSFLCQGLHFIATLSSALPEWVLDFDPCKIRFGLYIDPYIDLGFGKDCAINVDACPTIVAAPASHRYDRCHASSSQRVGLPLRAADLLRRRRWDWLRRRHGRWCPSRRSRIGDRMGKGFQVQIIGRLREIFRENEHAHATKDQGTYATCDRSEADHYGTLETQIVTAQGAIRT